MSALIKYANDKQKILDILSSIGIGVGDDAIATLEKNQIADFNRKFWDVPSSCTIVAVMDNNQADFGTKNYNPLKDTHHVDCLNVLQVIKPSGNPQLSKTSKTVEHLKTDFVEPNEFEKSAGISFAECFNALLLSVYDIQPAEELKEPVVQDIIPTGEGGGSSSLVSDVIVRFIKEDGNVLKQRLLLCSRYKPFYLNDPSDESISWDNVQSSKTSLRYLKLGKSTDDHVFLDCLDFLFKTFKTDDRDKMFVTLDQALHSKFKNLISQGKMPKDYVNFFIAILDPFHFQWCLLKCIFSAFEKAGLKDLVDILGIDNQNFFLNSTSTYLNPNSTQP